MVSSCTGLLTGIRYTNPRGKAYLQRLFDDGEITEMTEA
jgi:hypothetical protein